MDTIKLRSMMLLASLCLALLYILSRYMAPYKDLRQLCAATGLCCLWVLYRGTHKGLRRQAFQCWLSYGGTPLGVSARLQVQMRAAFGWAMLDALWLSLVLTSSLPWGIPGVLAILFQGFFLAAFAMAESSRPELYADEEKTQAMDMMESLLCAQASAVLLCIAWIRDHAS